MKPSLATSLLNLTNAFNTWDTTLVVPHNGDFIDIGSATLGKKATTPIGAVDQPEYYPGKSVYRFDTSYKGINAIDSLISTLNKYQCAVGCDIGVDRNVYL